VVSITGRDGKLITDPAGFGSYLDIFVAIEKNVAKRVVNHKIL
jgi:hypothetical protein